MELQGRKILVVGFGKTGFSTTRFLLERGALVLEAAALPGLMAALATWRAEGADPGRWAARQSVIDRDSWLLALREAPESRAQQRQMGGSLLTLLNELGWPLPSGPPGRAAPPLAWPAAWAWALVALAIPERDGLEAYLYGWVAAQLSAAVRLVPLGPTEAQRIQLRLAPLIAERAGALLGASPEDLWSGGVGASLAQLGHGELYSRLFRS